MKTEQKYLLFWSALLLISFAYFILLFFRFSSISLQHLVQTCFVGLTSMIHFGEDIVPFVIAPLAGLAVLTIILKILFSFVKTQVKLTQITCKQIKSLPMKVRPILIEHNVQKDEVMVVQTQMLLAYTIGFLSPKIVLSTSLIKGLSDKELEAVILHEKYHLKHLHTLLFFIGEIVSSVLFLLPIFEDILIQMKLKFEAEADKTVLSYQKTARHLLNALQMVSSPPALKYYPGFATYALSDRVELLVQHSQPHRSFSVRKITISFLVGVVSLIVIQVPVSADTLSNSQPGSACESSRVCAKTCPTVEQPPTNSSSPRSETLQTSAPSSMSYSY